MGVEFVIQGLIVLSCIGIGARMGGVAVGLWGGTGVLLLGTFFNLPPGKFPVAAISIIFVVVTAAAAMQVAGGVDYLVGIAHRILRSHPHYITYLAPYVSWIFTIGAGTGNVYYSLLPVIEEVAYDNKVRPERPLALSPEASQLGITSSPVSAAMAIMIGLLAPHDFSLKDILLIVLPATAVCIFLAALIQNYRGKELNADPIYQKRLKDGLVKPPKVVEVSELAGKPEAKRSTWLFVGGVVLVVFFGFFADIRPQIMDGEGGFKPMPMTQLICIIMMLTGVAILLTGKVKPNKIPATNVFQSGMVSILALMGIAWMASTFIGAHKEMLSTVMETRVQSNLFLLPVAYYILAALTCSQSTATVVITPIALVLGVEPSYIVASWIAVIGIHFFPANGSQIATIEFDRSGTTRIGNFVLNHSFMVPNLMVAGFGVATGFLAAFLFF